MPKDKLTTREIALLALHMALDADECAMRLLKTHGADHDIDAEHFVSAVCDASEFLTGFCLGEGDDGRLTRAMRRLREAQEELNAHLEMGAIPRSD